MYQLSRRNGGQHGEWLKGFQSVVPSDPHENASVDGYNWPSAWDDLEHVCEGYLKQADAEGETCPHCETHCGVQYSIKGKRMWAEHQRSSSSASSLWIRQTSHVVPHSHDFFTRMVCVPWTIWWNEPLLSCIASSQVSCHSNKRRNHYRSRPFFFYTPLSSLYRTIRTLINFKKLSINNEWVQLVTQLEQPS